MKSWPEIPPITEENLYAVVCTKSKLVWNKTLQCLEPHMLAGLHRRVYVAKDTNDPDVLSIFIKQRWEMVKRNRFKFSGPIRSA